MHTIDMQDAEQAGGGLSIMSFTMGQILGPLFAFTNDAIWHGRIDYAGVAEQQGHYYNMVGA